MGWDDNCSSGVTLAMFHKLSGIPTYGLYGLRKEHELEPLEPVL